jgi:predicted dehydrogenase
VIPVLAVATRPGPGLRSLFRHLSGTGLFELRVAGPEALAALNGTKVVLGVSDRPLRPDQAEALAGWLRGGGGLVTLGGTAAAWAENPELDGLLGAPPLDPSPQAELLVRPVPGHPITDRLEAEIPITDRLPLAGDAEGTPLLTVPWHYRDVVLAYERGKLVNLGLGWSDGALGHPALRQLVHRALRHAAGEAPSRPVRIGMIGFGAIGREHAEAASNVAGVRLVAVCDRAQPRLDAAKAEFDARGYLEPAELLADPDVDLVVVGTPPATHAEVVLEALRAGKHVVCEKPFALRLEEVDAMLAAAAENGRRITVYQSRRWDPDFVAVREAVRDGAIGDLFYLESFIGGFGHPCSYWHSHEPISGGTIYDWGSHYFDWMLQLVDGPVASVSAVAHKRVWHDVTNSDQVRVDVQFRDGRQGTFLQSDVAAALKPKWYLLGTAGAITGDWREESVKSRAWTGDLVEERLNPPEAPAIVTVHRPSASGESHHERLALQPRAPYGFYRNLADHLLLEEPLAVRPEESRRAVGVMEAATRSIASGGRPVKLSI